MDRKRQPGRIGGAPAFSHPLQVWRGGRETAARVTSPPDRDTTRLSAAADAARGELGPAASGANPACWAAPFAELDPRARAFLYYLDCQG